MPTASKLVAGLLLALLAIVASGQIKELMPPNTAFGYFTWVNAGIGFLCGWMIIGSRVGRGGAAAVSNGFTAVAALVFWGLFVQAVNEMVRLAVRHRYDGPVEAFAAVFEIGIEYGTVMLDWPLVLTLFAGGVATGIFTEIASRHWR
ncbi:TrgA family protein [Aestuariicoccus sp. MJ-SS9]|uniref:TrgA family protein n=1 Tax=Aestuariicoccus sp. MJ-SS9 TaxID=3079855 RepID=UPI00291553E8|nr:TrgA family protein [Aestuariicoccus sp. MJ-SS9]MDU8913204.1 TrgA family protein [Aestuariicoccus sp. MJ-SS9]